ncbi:MAG: glycosyltransferase [Leadbetterella sp.]
MNYLIVDLNITLDGHKIGFVNNIHAYVSGLQDSNSYHFLLNRTSDDSSRLEEKSGKVIYLNAETEAGFESSSHALIRYDKQWKFICIKARELNIDRLILLEMDLYQVSIGISKVDFEISGIWFRPHVRMIQEGIGIRAWIKFKRTILQKKWTLSLALRNKQWRHVFILNDQKVVNQLKKMSPVFEMLPDPVFEYKQLEGFDLRKKYNIEKDKVIFLLFGYIDDRKNVKNILKAANSLIVDDAQKACFLLIGKFEKGYDRVISELTGAPPHYQIIQRDEFITDEEMESTFAQSDVILRMNVNFTGSSGIVGIGAKYDKPCIVSDTGIMAELVDEYKIGVLCPPDDISWIAMIIKTYLGRTNKYFIDGSAYLESHSTKKFVETLLS